MAVDKLVDSSQLDADLTSVANAIRTKGGTSASLAFPADFVSAIGAIPTGGGGGGDSGSFTPASDTGTVTISALAGTSLNHFLLKITGNINSGKSLSKRAFLFCFIDFDKDCAVGIATNSAGSSTAYTGGYAPVSTAVYSLNRTTGVFTVSTSVNYGGVLVSGLTYDWIAW